MTNVVRYRYHLGPDGSLQFGGHVIGGQIPRQQRLARKHGTTCVECGEDKGAGVFAVGGDSTLGSPDFVNFTCRDCLEDLHDGDYDYSNTKRK